MITDQEKCITSNAQNVELMHKYPLNQMVNVQFTVENAIKNKEDQDIR